MRNLGGVLLILFFGGCASTPLSPEAYYVNNDLTYQKAWFIINLNEKIKKNQADLTCVQDSKTHNALLECLKVAGYTDDDAVEGHCDTPNCL